MKNVISCIILIASIVLGVYVGFFVLFIHPIMAIANGYDAGTLTGAFVAVNIVKCLLAGTCGSLIIYIGSAISTLISA